MGVAARDFWLYWGAGLLAFGPLRRIAVHPASLSAEHREPNTESVLTA